MRTPSAHSTLTPFQRNSWILGVVICYLNTVLLDERLSFLLERLRAKQPMPLSDLRRAHTKACALIDFVDEQFQHVTTAWVVVGWALLIFILAQLLLASFNVVMKGALVVWLVAGTVFQGKKADWVTRRGGGTSVTPKPLPAISVRESMVSHL